MESLSLFGFSWQMPGTVRTAIRTPAINQAKSLRLSDSLCCVYCTQFVAGTLYLCCILEQAIPGWHTSQSHWCWLHALQLRPCDVACVNSDIPQSNTADDFLIIMLAKLSSCHLVLPKTNQLPNNYMQLLFFDVLMFVWPSFMFKFTATSDSRPWQEHWGQNMEITSQRDMKESN